MKTTSGRCRKCNIRWVWEGYRVKLRDARCPNCGERIKATSYLFKGQTLVAPQDRMIDP